jgi:hypothetical protein
MRLVYYQPFAAGIKARMQSEFPKALNELAAKGRVEGAARVLKFPAPARS